MLPFHFPRVTLKFMYVHTSGRKYFEDSDHAGHDTRRDRGVLRVKEVKRFIAG